MTNEELQVLKAALAQMSSWWQTLDNLMGYEAGRTLSLEDAMDADEEPEAKALRDLIAKYDKA